MVDYNVTFPEGDAVNPIQAAGHTVLRAAKKYKKWTPEDIKMYLLQFYMMAPGTSMRKFHEANLVEPGIPHKTFWNYWTKSGLDKLQETGTAYEMAKIAIEHYIAVQKKRRRSELLMLAKATAIFPSRKKKVLFILLSLWARLAGALTGMNS